MQIENCFNVCVFVRVCVVCVLKVQMESKISELESRLSLSETKLHEERAVTQTLKQELHRVLKQHETVRNVGAWTRIFQNTTSCKTPIIWRNHQMIGVLEDSFAIVIFAAMVESRARPRPAGPARKIAACVRKRIFKPLIFSLCSSFSFLIHLPVQVKSDIQLQLLNVRRDLHGVQQRVRTLRMQ